ncbi:hypothetical protein BBJ28_00015990 [Nothophytophthora sp. Chile5]|nr:hypothetical protein BBJ28_00015990 [Nothophytophthora sp. Chile5]
MTSPHPAPTQDTYSTDLFRAFPKVCQKAKSGVQLCQAVASFVTERASVESNYAQALLKLTQYGTKVRWAQQQMITSMEKAKEKYDRKCQEAAELTGVARKPDTVATGDAGNSSASESPDDISASKELTDKLTAGAGQLLTKMWDTTSSFGRNPAERQRAKLYNCLEEVSSAEKHYVQTVEYTNAQRLIFEREIKENLHAFQLTEEQRLEYLKDVLLRMQTAFITHLPYSGKLAGGGTNSFYWVCMKLADIEKGFQSLGSQEEVDVNRADLSNNPFFLRITHIQTMSDSGQQMIEVINSVMTEFITIENRFSQSLRKLLRTHESGGLASPADLFGTSSSNINANFLADEGESMANGWTTARDQVKLLLEVHQEIEVFISTYMKNEQYRLQVSKNSLQSLAKAVDHMLLGGISVGNKALIGFGKINPSSDITDFIRINRQPYERSKRIVPAYHGNDKLKEVMREYLASFGSSASVQSEPSGRISRRTSYDNYPALTIPTDDRLSSPEQSPRADASSPENDQAMTTNGSLDTDRGGFDEDKTGIEQNDDYDAQPLGVSDFQKKFKVKWSGRGFGIMVLCADWVSFVLDACSWMRLSRSSKATRARSISRISHSTDGST